MIGALTINEISEAKNIVKQLKVGNDENCVVLEGMAYIDLITLCNILLPEYNSISEISSRTKYISGAAVLEIPNEIKDTLANLEDDQVKSISQNWSQCEEFRDLLSEEELFPFLKESIILAKLACSNNKPLMFINL